MRALHRVRLDKIRPAVLLTREVALPFLSGITLAPITSTIRGIATEVPVGRRHGLDHDSVISCDNITTIRAADVLEHLGYLDDADEVALLRAIHAAFGLLPPPSPSRRTGPPVRGPSVPGGPVAGLRSTGRNRTAPR